MIPNFETKFVSKINLDIDQDFYSFTRSYDYEDLRAKIREIFPAPSRSVLIRKSSNGNLHVKIESDAEFTLFDSMMIRAYLGDDHSRIARDLARLFQFGDIGLIARLFDEKHGKNGLMKAGDWEVMEV